MGLTIAQKIMAEHCVDGTLKPGDKIGIRIDQCLTQDSTGTMAWLEFESLGIDSVKSELAVSYNDHTSLGFKGESTDDHHFLMSIASKYGAIYSKPGNGVCHQIHYERFGIPGKTLLGSDSHTPTAGGLSMMAIGAGGMDVAVAMGGGLFYIDVPEIIQVKLTGQLSWGVSAKDVILTLLRMISVKGGVGSIIEYSGDGVKTLSVPERATITNMGAETGATTSIFPSDEVAQRFLKAQGREDVWRPLEADHDAVYNTVIEIDLATIEPVVSMTGMPDNVKDMNEVEGTHLDQVFIGSCTNGGYTDLRKAALVIQGKSIASHIDCIVSPGSRQVQLMLIQDGSYDIFTKAGCRMIDPGCNACIGIGFVPGFEHRSLRTVNRNWKGRGGSEHANLCLSSVETAIVSAIAGHIADPRKADRVIVAEPLQYIVNDTLLLMPRGGNVNIKRSPNIRPMRHQSEPSSVLTGEVLIKVGDGISTDDILPAGPLTQHLRSNLPEIARYVFYYIDDNFAVQARAKNGGFIIGGDNYGQGSSREHAALAPHELKVKAIFARSFARIHHANLINAGIIPFECDTSLIDKGDALSIAIDDLNGKLVVNNITKGIEIPVRINMGERDKKIVRAGGLLAYTRISN